MSHRIRIGDALLTYTRAGCFTVYDDGSSYGAHPHDTAHYHVIAHRCGYGDDLLAYCREHEFSHLYVADRILGRPSAVLWPLAHGRDPDPAEALAEECMAQAFQRWLRAAERPIIAGIAWDRLKGEALGLLKGVGA